MKRFSNSSSSIIIAAISIALLGLSWAQIRLVTNSIELSDQLFSQQVHEALSNVARKLEDVEHVADAVMISSRQHETAESAKPVERKKPSVKVKEEKKPDSVMANARDRRSNSIGFAMIPASNHQGEVSSNAGNSGMVGRQQTRGNLLPRPLPPAAVPAGSGSRATLQGWHPQSVRSQALILSNQSARDQRSASNMRVDLRQTNGQVELSVSSDLVSTSSISSTSEPSHPCKKPQQESAERVHCWDSVIKQLSGNVAVRFFDVQDDLYQTMQQLQNEQFVLRQNTPQRTAFQNQSGLQTSVGYLVDGSMNPAYSAGQNSTYSVAQGEPEKMRHTKCAVPVLHTKEHCDGKNCGMCAVHDGDDSSASAKAEYMESVECTKRIQNKINLIQQTVQDLREFSTSLEDRVNQMMIDSMIASEFSTKNLPMDYGFGVMNGENSHFVYAKNSSSDELVSSPYKSTLFPGDIVRKNHKLFVTFPTKQSYIVKQNAGILSFSALFMVMIISSFGWTMRNLNRHKKVSEMKSDFINNMTHEFKTPIATIALAADALRDPQVNSSGERVGRFIGVIREENQRLGSQVERVLQAAKLDRGELALSKTDVDIHELIGVTKDSITLQVDARGGIITTDLRAEFPAVCGDEMHIRNVLLNLLDNANKYTTEKPVINISTRNINNGVMISVRDNGIGISKESQKRIFEKLYRVPTGNVHNVKGFGLGLSYVKAIVEAHGGFVHVESEIAKGSRFDVFLPFGVVS